MVIMDEYGWKTRRYNSMKKLVVLLLSLLTFACQKKQTFELSSPTGGDFSIQTTKGIYSTRVHRGKVLFLFFGFTHCPQICPKTLSQLNLMTKKLTAEEKEKVQILFVSVDVERDTLEVLKNRLSHYSSNFYGGVDTEENLNTLMAKFGATYAVYRGKTPEETAIDHTTEIFVINDKGVWVNSLKYDSTAEEILDAYKSANKMSPIYAKHRQNRTIEVIDENKKCDLSKTSCKLGDYEVSISPLPITTEKNYTVKVKLLNPEVTVPSELDLQGFEINMGYIRPKLIETEPNIYSGKFYIPSCELPEMLWRARLILETPKGNKSLNFYLRSVSG